MTATPRTDAALYPMNGVEIVWPDFARQLETELARLRADLERFTGHGLLDCHAICDQRDAAVAERDQLRAEVERLDAEKPWLKEANARAAHAEAMLAEAKVERETVAEASLRSLKSYIDKLKQFAERAEKAEVECLEQARLLGMSGEREADLLGKIERLNRVIERASVQFFHDGSDGETAAKMLTVLNEAK